MATKRKTPTFLLELPLVVHEKEARCAWLADHLDAVLAQTLATRAYQALNRVCTGQARRVRFKSRGRGLDSIENKRNDTGLRFVLQPAEEGNQGALLWNDDRLPALIDWHDPVITHGLAQRIKYARLLRRLASSPKAAGADSQGYRYFVQLALEGIPHHKPTHSVGTDTIGIDLGPSTIAIVPRQADARLELLCEELQPDAKALRRLHRKMERQRRAANPQNYDERGRPKTRGTHRLHWQTSKGYEQTRRRKAAQERRLAAHRKSLQGRLAHEIVKLGNTIMLEKISYRVPSTPSTGKVRRRACGQHTSESKNARKRGRSCPKAWALLVPERVCLKVRANRHKSQPSSCEEGDWKRGRKARNPRCLSTRSFQKTRERTARIHRY